MPRKKRDSQMIDVVFFVDQDGFIWLCLQAGKANQRIPVMVFSNVDEYIDFVRILGVFRDTLVNASVESLSNKVKSEISDILSMPQLEN